ncbi:MAG: septum formation protein Maf [Sedimentisphaerales bacterium]|nr:septum formation protein Maf [Sedimentisphaerales bacterium]
MIEQSTLLVLASASPRRRELLAKAGYAFRVEPSNVDEESYDKAGITSEEHCQMLALAKAREVAGRFPDLPVLGSDTVVDFDGQIIGKPADAADAERITRMLFSKPHKVITGLALIWKSKGIEIADVDTTIVYPHKLTEQQIQGHIAGGLWEGKAGAYGIQETGDEFVDRIEGSFTNVMGLPMERVECLLRRCGVLTQ